MNDYMDMFTEWTEGQILAADSTLGGERRVIFYQVVERTRQTVKVRRIRANTTKTATGFETSPAPGDFADERVIRRALQVTGHISVNDVHLARLWDGRPSNYRSGS